MDFQRLILFFVFSFSLLMLWEAWQREARGPQPPAATATPTPSAALPAPGTSPKPAATPTAKPAAPGVPAGETAAAPRERVRVTTDTLVADIDTLGGNIVYLELLRHKDQNDNTKNMVLFGPEHRYSAQSGLIGPGLPSHLTPFRAEQKQVSLAPGNDRVEVRLQAPGQDGAKVTKILTFHRGS